MNRSLLRGLAHPLKQQKFNDHHIQISYTSSNSMRTRIPAFLVISSETSQLEEGRNVIAELRKICNGISRNPSS
uniref:Uncharacterized protein n=1 Tax=Arundo donax TaxID=35708 RepID=A0A0A9F2J7_ARUDO